jgi:hypothetical protein
MNAESAHPIPLTDEEKNKRRRVYYRKNRERILADLRKRRAANPERMREQRRKWYAANRERINALQRKRYYAKKKSLMELSLYALKQHLNQNRISASSQPGSLD